MSGIVRKLVRAGGSRAAMKAIKTVPLLGTAVVVGLAGYEIKKKGLVRGLLNTALDATPIVGVAKNAIEIFTGDLLPDKPNGASSEAASPKRSDTLSQAPTGRR